VITDYRVKNLTQDKTYFFIQDAVDEANDSDVLEALESIYYENVDFDGIVLTLRSTDPNDWDVVAHTIIDGNDGDYAAKLYSSADSTLAGLTLRNATYGAFCMTSADPTIKNCIVEENTHGIFAFNTVPTIINNKITENTSCGIAVVGSQAQQIKNNWIYANDHGINLISSGADKLIRNNTIVDQALHPQSVTALSGKMAMI
jgi:parallel beta-helix repeat protein